VFLRLNENISIVLSIPKTIFYAILTLPNVSVLKLGRIFGKYNVVELRVACDLLVRSVFRNAKFRNDRAVILPKHLAAGIELEKSMAIIRHTGKHILNVKF